MVSREMALSDGRRVRFRIQAIRSAQESGIKSELVLSAAEDVLELFSSDSDGDPQHPAFFGARYSFASLTGAVLSGFCRQGLPLRTASGATRLSLADSRWLLARVESGRVDEVEICPQTRSRPSALAR